MEVFRGNGVWWMVFAALILLFVGFQFLSLSSIHHDSYTGEWEDLNCVTEDGCSFTYPETTMEYASKVLRQRFIEGEDILKSDEKLWEAYVDTFLDDSANDANASGTRGALCA